MVKEELAAHEVEGKVVCGPAEEEEAGAVVEAAACCCSRISMREKIFVRCARLTCIERIDAAAEGKLVGSYDAGKDCEKR